MLCETADPIKADAEAEDGGDTAPVASTGHPSAKHWHDYQAAVRAHNSSPEDRGAVAVESERAKRLLKRAQALAVTAAFGLHFSIAADRAEAERRACRLLTGEALADDTE